MSLCQRLPVRINLDMRETVSYQKLLLKIQSLINHYLTYFFHLDHSVFSISLYILKCFIKYEKEVMNSLQLVWSAKFRLCLYKPYHNLFSYVAHWSCKWMNSVQYENIFYFCMIFSKSQQKCKLVHSSSTTFTKVLSWH